MLGEILDLTRQVYAVYNAFDFGSHVARMRGKHPEWSNRQVECCLYWQGTARVQLREQVVAFFGTAAGRSMIGVVLDCPEACGVDVTATMRLIGIELEWPPKTVAYQVALVGHGLGE
jgi:hypothetical protein